MFTKYENGAEVDITEVCRYEDGAEVEAEAMYKYDADIGAEVEVWSSGVPPVALYATSTMDSAGIYPHIDGTEIYLPSVYVATSNAFSRIIIQEIASGSAPPTIHIDRVVLPGDSGLSGTIKLRAFTYRGTPATGSISGTYVREGRYIFEGSITEGNEVSDIEHTFTSEITQDLNLCLAVYYEPSNYDSTYRHWEIPLYVYGLRVNGVRIAGDMVGSY